MSVTVGFRRSGKSGRLCRGRERFLAAPKERSIMARKKKAARKKSKPAKKEVKPLAKV